ncbi:MAG: FAD-dependent oxidoreductase [Oricola sp.]
MQSASAINSHDLAIIGAGIFGLWTAFHAARQGLSVVLIEKREIGAGASGGIMGALMPHHAVDWNAKKQFQMDGLISIETEVAALEDYTGMTAGYRRCGRVMPIRTGARLRQAGEWVEFARVNWPDAYGWTIKGHSIDPAWLPQTEMPFGSNVDTLSARVDPRGLVAALAHALRLLGVVIRENTAIERIDPDGTLHCIDEAVTAGHVVLAAGWESFDFLAGPNSESIGTGVKGQAALLRPVKPVDPALPILYDDGVYVIAHDNGCVAVGSTSENSYADPFATDEKLDAVIATAQGLCPALDGAEVMERWAGIRPKAEGREPLVGPMPGFANLLIATGGFKISFAIAHLVAKALLAQIEGERPAFLPKVFLPENRLHHP